MKRCPICDTENTDGAKSCEVCGEPLAPLSTAPPAPTVPQEEPLGQIADTVPAASPSPLTLDEFDRLLAEGVPETVEVVREDFTDTPVLERDSVEAILGDIRHLSGVVTGDLPVVEVVGEAELVASLIVYERRRPKFSVELVHDETLIGRRDPAAQNFPDLDLTDLIDATIISRRHAHVLREAGSYFLSPISTAGTQLGNRLLQPGERARLADGDVIVLSGQVAIKFQLADTV